MFSDCAYEAWVSYAFSLIKTFELKIERQQSRNVSVQAETAALATSSQCRICTTTSMFVAIRQQLEPPCLADC